MSRVVVVRLGLLFALAVLALAGGALLTASSAHADDSEIFIDPADGDRFVVTLNGPGQITGPQNADNDSYVEINLTGTTQASELRIVLDQQNGDGRLGVERIETDSTSGIGRILGRLTVYLRGNGGESDGIVIPGDVEEIEVWRVSPYGGIHVDGNIEELDIRTDATFTPSGPLNVTGDIGTFFVRFLRIMDDEGDPASRGLLEAFTVGGDVVDIQINSQLTIDSGIASIGGDVGTLEVLRWVNIQNGGTLAIGGNLQSLIISGASGAGNSLRMREDGNLTVGGLINTATLAGSLRLNLNSHIAVTETFTDLVVGLELPGQGGGHLVIGDDSALTVGGALGHVEVFGSDPTTNISIWVRQSSLFTTGGGAPDITTYGDFRVVRGSYFEATALGDWSIGGNIHSAVAPGFNIKGPGNHIETGGDVRILKDADFIIDGDLDSFNIFGDLLVEGELVVDGFIRRLSADDVEVSAGSAPGLEITGGAGRINVNPGNFLVQEASTVTFGGKVDEFLVQSGNIEIDFDSHITGTDIGTLQPAEGLLIHDNSSFVLSGHLGDFFAANGLVELTTNSTFSAASIGNWDDDLLISASVYQVAGNIGVFETGILTIQNGGLLDVGGDIGSFISAQVIIETGSDAAIAGDITDLRGPVDATDGIDGFSITGGSTWISGGIQNFILDTAPFVLSGSENAFTATGPIDNFNTNDQDVIIDDGATFEAQGGGGQWSFNQLLVSDGSFFLVEDGGLSALLITIDMSATNGSVIKLPDVTSDEELDATLQVGGNVIADNGSQVLINGPVDDFQVGLRVFIQDGSDLLIGGRVWNWQVGDSIVVFDDSRVSVSGDLNNLEVVVDIMLDEHATFRAASAGNIQIDGALTVNDASVFNILGALGAFESGASLVSITNGSTFHAGSIGSYADDLLVQSGSTFAVDGSITAFKPQNVDVLQASALTVGGDILSWHAETIEVLTASEIVVGGNIGELRGPVDAFDGVGQLTIESDSLFQAGSIGTIRLDTDDFELVGAAVFNVIGRIDDFELVDVGMFLDEGATFFAGSIGDFDIGGVLAPAVRGDDIEFCLVVDNGSEMTISGVLESFNCGGSVLLNEDSALTVGSAPGDFDISGALIIDLASILKVNGELADFSADFVDIVDGSSMEITGNVGSFISEFGISIFEASSLLIGGNVEVIRVNEGNVVIELDSTLSITGDAETIEAFGEFLEPPAERGFFFGGDFILTESVFNVGGTLQNFRFTGLFSASSASTFNVGDGLGSFRVNNFLLNEDSLFNVGGAAGIGSMAGPFEPDDGIDGMLILNSSTVNVSAGPLQSLVIDGFVADFNGGGDRGIFPFDPFFEYGAFGLVLDEKATFFVAGDFGHLEINGVAVLQPPAERGGPGICRGGLLVDNGSTIHAGSAGSWEVNCQVPFDEDEVVFIFPASTIVDSGSQIKIVGNMGSFLDQLGVQITSASTFTMGSLSLEGDSTWQTGGALIISQGSIFNVANNADEIKSATLFVGEGSDFFIGGNLRSLWVTGVFNFGDRGGLPEFWVESGSVVHVNGNVDSILVGFPATANVGMNDNAEISVDGTLSSFTVTGGVGMEDNSLIRVGNSTTNGSLLSLQIAGEEREAERGAMFNGLEMTRGSDIEVWGDLGSLSASFEGPVDISLTDSSEITVHRNVGSIFAETLFLDDTSRINVDGNVEALNATGFWTLTDNSQINVGGNLDDFSVEFGANLSAAGKFIVKGNVGNVIIDGNVDLMPGALWSFGDAAADTVGVIRIGDTGGFSLGFNDLRGGAVIQTSGSVSTFLYCTDLIGTGSVLPGAGLNGTIRLAYMGGVVQFFGPCEDAGLDIPAERGGLVFPPQTSGIYNIDIVVGDPGPDMIVDTADDVADADLKYFGAAELSPRLSPAGAPVSNGSRLWVQGAISTIEIGVYLDIDTMTNIWGHEYCGMWRSQIVAEQIGQGAIQGACETGLDFELLEILDADGAPYDPVAAMLDSQIYYKGEAGPGNMSVWTIMGDVVGATRATRIITGFNGGLTFYADRHLTIDILPNDAGAIGMLWDAAVAASVDFNDPLSARPLLYDAGEDPAVPGGGFISHSEAVIGPGSGAFDDTNYYAETVTP